MEVNKKQHTDAWAKKSEPERQKRIAFIAAQDKAKKQAEDEITAADRRKFEAAQKKKYRLAP